MEIRPAVQKQSRHAGFILLHAEFAHAEIAFHAILAHAHFAVIKIRVLRRPGLKAFHADRYGHSRRPMLHHVPNADDAGQRAVRILRIRAYFHGTFVKMWGDAQRRNIILRHAFAPYRLPYAALGRIPDAAAPALLLAAGVEGRVAHIAHTHKKRVFPFFQNSCDVKGKRQISARMRSKFHFVQIDRCRLIDCAEMQKDTADVKACRQRERARVPQRLIRLQHALHAGKLTFRRKRDQDLPFRLCGQFTGFCDCILPNAVQVQVALARHLRAGILREDRIPFKRFAPYSFHFLLLLFKMMTGTAVQSSITAAARKIAGVGTFLTTPSST